MGPITKEKPKHVYQPPAWIDDEFIKTLSKEKQEYWANRKKGISGMGEAPKPKITANTEGGQISFDNDGNMVVKTREYRRKKPTRDNKYTKKQLVPKRKR